MTAPGVRPIVVGRVRRPHGLKGEVTVFPLTDDPAAIFGPGRALWVVDLEGQVTGGPLEVERSRAYHREWLVKFRGMEGREPLEALRHAFLAVPEDALPALAADEVYVGDLAGFAVQDEAGQALGVVTDVYELPAGLVIEVQGPKREFLLPWVEEFVRDVSREARRLVVRVPDGLLD